MPLTLRTTLLAALVSGLLAGLVFFAVQGVSTRPLIVQAEVLEHAAAPVHAHGVAGAHQHAHAWEPAHGAERTLYTLAADVLIGIGFGFLLVGAVGLSGRGVGPGSGLLWGLAGFVVFAAAPAMGLPPEPPGAEAADLVSRQVWWAGTALATAAGLWALLLQDRLWVALLGLVAIAMPHVIGAPEAAVAASPEHEALALRFLWASLGANLALWVVLGVAAGFIVPRLVERPRLGVARA